MLISQENTEEAFASTGLVHRLYRSQEPGELSSRLVLLIHGRAGNSRVMWTFSRLLGSERQTVIAPQAFIPDPQGGWSWWDIEDNKSKKQGFSSECLALACERLRNFLFSALDYYQLQPSEIIAVGFSQGGALATSLALAYPDLFSKVAMLAGFLPEVASKEYLRSKTIGKAGDSRESTGFFIAHGAKDEIVPLEVAYAVAKWLRQNGFSVKYATDDVGHKIGINAQRELQKWLCDLP